MRSYVCGLATGSWLVLLSFLGPNSSIAVDRDGARTSPAPSAPKVVLVGDSIRLGYAPIVASRLEGKAIVVSPAPNSGDSANVLKHLEEWVIREQPAIVDFNCGIHDTKKSRAGGRFQVSPEAYEGNLRAIVGRIRSGTKATVVFATSTRVIDDRAARARSRADYELLDASIERYNAIARNVMDELEVPVDDLRLVVGEADTRAKLIGDDGIHFRPEGREALGDAVATFLTRFLPAGPAAPGAGAAR